jgi:hypothetical protein
MTVPSATWIVVSFAIRGSYSFIKTGRWVDHNKVFAVKENIPSPQKVTQMLLLQPLRVLSPTSRTVRRPVPTGHAAVR